jgi:hypothetical protein
VASLVSRGVLFQLTFLCGDDASKKLLRLRGRDNASGVEHSFVLRSAVTMGAPL